ncbi:hypothetical protein SLEP1_g59764 [Rubroshorea leprosula]|uniref:Uncharacterized protein n=1 Tax=Rubroshorea leprosula TaxID=152421 RepID=A0AAV5MWJ2_9ROSI|nr:hypothetical protein SLEP1_g59764 [Rubroshorea leprosula]
MKLGSDSLDSISFPWLDDGLNTFLDVQTNYVNDYVHATSMKSPVNLPFKKYAIRNGRECKKKENSNEVNSTMQIVENGSVDVLICPPEVFVFCCNNQSAEGLSGCPTSATRAP